MREKRGRLVSAEVLFVGVGIVFAYWLDFGMSYASGALAWRLPIAVQMLFAVLVIVIVFGIPESPRWLVNHGRREEAIETLCAVHDTRRDDAYVVAEMEAIERAIVLESKSSKTNSFVSIFKQDEVRTRYRILLAWGVQFMNQAGGINLVVYYIPCQSRTYLRSIEKN